MQFAICHWKQDLTDEHVTTLVADGVKVIEVGAPLLMADAKVVEAAGKRCREAGIQVYSTHAPFGGESNLSATDEEKWQKAIDNHEKALAAAAILGARCMVIHPGAGNVTESENEERLIEQLLRALDRLLKRAEGHGIRLALENMLPAHLGDRSEVILRAVEHFSSPYLGVCFDIGHARLTDEGDVATFLALRKWIITFHLQDTDGTHDCHIQPPYGVVNWEEFIPAFKAFEWPFPIVVETQPWGGARWKVLLREMEALFSVGLLTVPLGDTNVHPRCARCGHYCFGTVDDWFCACES